MALRSLRACAAKVVAALTTAFSRQSHTYTLAIWQSLPLYTGMGSPLSRSRLLENERITAIAQSFGKPSADLGVALCGFTIFQAVSKLGRQIRAFAKTEARGRCATLFDVLGKSLKPWGMHPQNPLPSAFQDLPGGTLLLHRFLLDGHAGNIISVTRRFASHADACTILHKDCRPGAALKGTSDSPIASTACGHAASSCSKQGDH